MMLGPPSYGFPNTGAILGRKTTQKAQNPEVHCADNGLWQRISGACREPASITHHETSHRPPLRGEAALALMMRSAAFSPITIAGAFVCPLMMFGMTEASAMRKF